MAIEAVLIKPVVDALLALFHQADDIKLKRNAEAALREAIRELLQANPDENGAAARIAIARAAGILSEDIVLAEDMLQKHRATKGRTTGKAATGRRRKPGDTGPRDPAAHGARAIDRPARKGRPAAGEAPDSDDTAAGAATSARAAAAARVAGRRASAEEGR